MDPRAPTVRINIPLCINAAGGQRYDLQQLPRASEFYAITCGPRHTAGGIIVSNAGFDGQRQSPISGGVGASAADLLDPTVLVGPRNAFFGRFTGQTALWLPAYQPSAILLDGQPVPEIDLVFWRERPGFLPGRADLENVYGHATLLVNGARTLIPTAGRKEVSLIVYNVGVGASSVNIDLGMYAPQSGFIGLTRRYVNALALAAGATYAVSFGPMYAAPGTPGTGENGLVPGFVGVSVTAGNTNSCLIYASARD